MDKVLLPTKRPPDYANNSSGNGNRDLGNSSQGPFNDFQLRQQNTTQFNDPKPAQLYDRSVAINSLERNGENWLSFKGMQGVPGAEVPVT